MQTKANYAEDVEVLIEYPDDWVERVERGDIDSPETEASVKRVIQPWLDAGVDEIALGCTHYPFLAPLIIRITGRSRTVIDPSAAVARQTARVLHEHALLNPQAGGGMRTYFTSGSAGEFARVLEKLLGDKGTVHAAN